MAATTYVAICKCSIDGKKFDAGQSIEGVAQTRLDELEGRFVRQIDVAAEAPAADEKPTSQKGRGRK